MANGWVSTELGAGVMRVGPVGDDLDGPLSPEDYETGPGGCGVCYVLEPEVEGEDCEVLHCPNKATETAFGVTVCEGDRHWAMVDAWVYKRQEEQGG